MKDDNRPETENAGPLFREQAVAYQARSLDGEVLLSLSVRLHVLVVLALIVMATGLLFATFASYSRIETVQGWVVPEGGLIRIAARQGGTVERLGVTEGDTVKAGQSMAVLRLSHDTDTGNAGTAIDDYLEIELQAVRAQAVAEHERLLAQQESLNVQRMAMQAELDASKGRITTVTGRIALLRNNVDRVKTIAERGYASNKSVEDSEMTLLLTEQELVDARTDMMVLERQIKDVDAELKALPFSIRTAEAQAQASEAVLERQRTELSVMNTYHATATVDGRVVAVPVSQGQTLDSHMAVAVITPAGSQLQAELFVPSRAAGFIRPGQEVRLMYQAFPYQKFGSAVGTVSSVSRTVLAPTELSIPDLQISEPVFRVKVALSTEVVRAYSQEIPIQPGMLLSAGIVLDRRSLLEWLLDPIYAVGRM